MSTQINRLPSVVFKFCCLTLSLTLSRPPPPPTPLPSRSPSAFFLFHLLFSACCCTRQAELVHQCVGGVADWCECPPSCVRLPFVQIECIRTWVEFVQTAKLFMQHPPIGETIEPEFIASVSCVSTSSF